MVTVWRERIRDQSLGPLSHIAVFIIEEYIIMCQYALSPSLALSLSLSL